MQLCLLARRAAPFPFAETHPSQQPQQAGDLQTSLFPSLRHHVCISRQPCDRLELSASAHDPGSPLGPASTFYSHHHSGG